MQTLPPPSVAPGRATLATPVARPRGAWRLEALFVAALAALALAVRWPHLWTVPRFTDETLEVLHSLRIVREGARPLTNYDSYYGALYNYLVAIALWATGESPFAPRLVVLVAGALTVAATYLLGRELGRTPPPDPLPGAERGHKPPLRAGEGVGGGVLAPRLAGILAALLLVTNGAHVVVNSHIAWSNCLTPLFTTLAFWMLLSGGPALALAGLAFGLALQTHPLVAALLPGAAVYVVWRGHRWLRTPWPYLGLVLFLLGYGNVLIYNWETGFESLRSAQRIRAEYGQDQQATVGYLPTLGALLLLLARVLGGAVDQRGGSLEYLADPVVVLAGALTVVALAWLARRSQPLPLLLVTGFLVLLPLVNPKFATLLTSRYLMPIVPLLFASTAVYLVHLGRPLLVPRWAAIPRGRPIALGAALAAGLLVVAPLVPLGRYYARAHGRGDTNERIFRLSAEITTARRADEPVLIDETIGSELPDTGVTELRGLEHLLEFARVPHRAVRVTPSRLQDELRGAPSALAVLNARDAAEAATRLALSSLDPRPPAETGRMFDYRLYRIGARGQGSGVRGQGDGRSIPDPWPLTPDPHPRA